MGSQLPLVIASCSTGEKRGRRNGSGIPRLLLLLLHCTQPPAAHGLPIFISETRVAIIRQSSEKKAFFRKTTRNKFKMYIFSNMDCWQIGPDNLLLELAVIALQFKARKEGFSRGSSCRKERERERAPCSRGSCTFPAKLCHEDCSRWKYISL